MFICSSRSSCHKRYSNTAWMIFAHLLLYIRVSTNDELFVYAGENTICSLLTRLLYFIAIDILRARVLIDSNFRRKSTNG